MVNHGQPFTHIRPFGRGTSGSHRRRRDLQPVTGLTHNFYRYPARFSPAFVRAAIEAITEPGDYVLDPYMGGGTSLVEAVELGQNAVGVDISELTEFVASTARAVGSEAARAN